MSSASEYSFIALLFAAGGVVGLGLLSLLVPATLRWAGSLWCGSVLGFVTLSALIGFYPLLAILDRAIERTLVLLDLQKLSGFIDTAMNPWGYLGNAWLLGCFLGWWLAQRIKQRADSRLDWVGE